MNLLIVNLYTSNITSVTEKQSICDMQTSVPQADYDNYNCFSAPFNSESARNNSHSERGSIC